MRRTALALGCTAALLAAAAGTGTALAAPPEFTPPFPNPYTGTSKAMLLETVAKHKVKCTADSLKGEITGPATMTLRIDFTGCTTNLVAGVACQSPNGAPGEIQTELLQGTLGYITESPKLVGLDLQNPTGGLLFAFFCGAAVFGEVSGSVIGKVAPINKTITPPAHLTLAFAQTAGHQKYPHFMGGPIDVPLTRINGGPIEESGLASVETPTFAAPFKIIA